MGRGQAKPEPGLDIWVYINSLGPVLSTSPFYSPSVGSDDQRVITWQFLVRGIILTGTTRSPMKLISHKTEPTLPRTPLRCEEEGSRGVLEHPLNYFIVVIPALVSRILGILSGTEQGRYLKSARK